MILGEDRQPGGRIDHEGAADHQHEVGGLGDGVGGAQGALRQRFTEQHRARPQHAAAHRAMRIGFPGFKTPLDLDAGVGSATLGAAHEMGGAMQLDHPIVGVPGLLVQAVDILGDHRQQSPGGLEFGDRLVSGVGQSRQHFGIPDSPVPPMFDPGLVVGPDRIDVGDRLSRPHAVRSTVVGDSGLGADAGARKDREPVARADEIGDPVEILGRGHQG